MSGYNQLRTLLGELAATIAGRTLASSHREAAFISTHPSAGATDSYLLNSSRE